MIDLSYILVFAIVLFQLYIIACTYWVFKKIDRYENVALGIIERYLSRRHSTPHDINRDMTHGTSHDITHGMTRDITYNTPHDSTPHSTPYANVCSIQSSSSDVARNKILYKIQKFSQYAPERFHSTINSMVNAWYSQLCIDIFTILINDDS